MLPSACMVASLAGHRCSPRKPPYPGRVRPLGTLGTGIPLWKGYKALIWLFALERK